MPRTVKATTTPAPAPTLLPPVPVLPSSWTASSTITYALAVALFIIGLLTQAGVTIPSNVSTEVQVWAGVAGEIVSVLTALSTHVTNSSLVKYLASLSA